MTLPPLEIAVHLGALLSNPRYAPLEPLVDPLPPPPERGGRRHRGEDQAGPEGDPHEGEAGTQREPDRVPHVGDPVAGVAAISDKG